MALTKVLSTCGFCNTGHHENCVIGTVKRKSSKYPGGVVWVCRCPHEVCSTIRKDHPAKCTTCGNRTPSEVDKETWLCIDTGACHATVTARRDSDPLLASLRKAQEMAKITEGEKKATKAKAAPKTGTCVCGCNGTTKGGLFLPGHDARFVSGLVANAEEKNFSKASLDSGRKALKDAGASDALKAKFEKSAGLAQERAEKKAQAAKEKADAKAEKAKA
jgi:hypothetical protein